MKKILFLCTGNSCRSQMAEGFCKHYHAGVYECFSAGIEAHRLNTSAVEVMNEVGIDISDQKSKTVAQLPDVEFDYVVTVCGDADENCPFFPAKTKKLHIGFDDPAKHQNDMPDDQKMDVFRRVRNEIRQMVLNLPKLLSGDEKK